MNACSSIKDLGPLRDLPNLGALDCTNMNPDLSFYPLLECMQLRGLISSWSIQEEGLRISLPFLPIYRCKEDYILFMAWASHREDWMCYLQGGAEPSEPTPKRQDWMKYKGYNHKFHSSRLAKDLAAFHFDDMAEDWKD